MLVQTLNSLKQSRAEIALPTPTLVIIRTVGGLILSRAGPTNQVLSNDTVRILAANQPEEGVAVYASCI